MNMLVGKASVKPSARLLQKQLFEVAVFRSQREFLSASETLQSLLAKNCGLFRAPALVERSESEG